MIPEEEAEAGDGKSELENIKEFLDSNKKYHKFGKQPGEEAEIDGIDINKKLRER